MSRRRHPSAHGLGARFLPLIAPPRRRSPPARTSPLSLRSRPARTPSTARRVHGSARRTLRRRQRRRPYHSRPTGAQPAIPDRRHRSRERRGMRSLGWGRGCRDASRRAGLMSAYPFPITGAKVHPPLLRADTLSRPRLNDWLDRAATGRVVLVIAEAGFGKTTLLADWAPEVEPTDGVVPPRAGRHVTGSSSCAISSPRGARSTRTSVPTRWSSSWGWRRWPVTSRRRGLDRREYGDFAATAPRGPDADRGRPPRDRRLRGDRRGSFARSSTARSMASRSSSRPVPRRRLPLGGLRSRGGLSRLDGADLRFDVPETDRLFREAYQRPLDPDVVDQLIKRTRDGQRCSCSCARASRTRRSNT